MQEQIKYLVAECKRQEESCLYTSTTLYIWLRMARITRMVFVIMPIILGAIATWSVLDRPEIAWLKWLTATSAFLAGIFPAVYKALDIDDNVEQISQHAARFKNLQDRFRQAADVTSLSSFENFEAEFKKLMQQMDDARESSITPPEWCFKRAQRKIRAGHYKFDYDIKK